MPVVPAGLHHVRTRAEPHLRFSFRRLDVRARYEHDLHGVGVRVKGSGESRRKLEERAERSLRMVAPQIRDFDARSAGGIEVGPFQVAGRREDGLAWRGFRCRGGLRLSGDCARTGAASVSAIENARTFLGLIDSSFADLQRCGRLPPGGPKVSNHRRPARPGSFEWKTVALRLRAGAHCGR